MSALNLPEAIESLKLPLLFDSFLQVVSGLSRRFCRNLKRLFSDLRSANHHHLPENWVVTSEPPSMSSLMTWSAPAVKLQTETGNGISVGDGGELGAGQVANLNNIWKSFFSFENSQVLPGGVLTGGRGGMLREREISFQSWDLNTQLWRSE